MSSALRPYDVLYVVVNASDPERHEVALCSTREYAERLASDMHTEHGWLYEVVEEIQEDE